MVPTLTSPVREKVTALNDAPSTPPSDGMNLVVWALEMNKSDLGQRS
jgi:hypothetical protein